LGRIHQTEAQWHPNQRQTFGPWIDDPLKQGTVAEQLDLQRLARSVDATSLGLGPAGLFEELDRAGQKLSIPPRAVRNRWRVRLVKDRRVQLVAKWLQQGQNLAFCLATGLHCRAFKEGVGALIKAEKQLLIRPFEIEGDGDRFACSRIGKFAPPGVEEPALRRRWFIVWQLELLHPSIRQCREVILRCPALGGKFLPKIEIALLEALKGRGGIAAKTEADDIEIMVADGGWQILAPIIGVPVKLDHAARIDQANLIGAGADRRRERRAVKGLAVIIGLGENWHNRGRLDRVLPRLRAVKHQCHAVIRGFDFVERPQG